MIIVKMIFCLILIFMSSIMAFENNVTSTLDMDVYFDRGELHGIRKCCDEGETMNLTSKECSPSPNDSVELDASYGDLIHVPEAEICSAGKLRVKISENFVVYNGVLMWDDFEFTTEDFCLIIIENKTVALLCIVSEVKLEEKALGIMG